MSKIVNTKDTELLITYAWSSKNHGISGHTFEVIDYFFLLNTHFNCKILIPEIIPFFEAIQDKYNLTPDQFTLIQSKTIQVDKPVFVACNNVLFVDGAWKNIQNLKLSYNKMFLFACGDKSINDINDENIKVLADHRIYGSLGINYNKKINFSIYKQHCKTSNIVMMYGTENCRMISEELINKYDNMLLIANDGFYDVEYLRPPVKNLFDKFGTYVYTPVPRKFDCSSRFIAECKFYNKEVIYEINYIEEDRGLYWRKHDVENDFDKVVLKENDAIINILKEVI